MSEKTVAYSENVKEAVERTEESEALRFEATVRKFNGDKIAAEKYLRHKLGMAANIREQARYASKKVWGN